MKRTTNPKASSVFQNSQCFFNPFLIKFEIIIGDCLKELPKIPNESIDLVFADPPYNMSKKKGLGWKYSKHITMQEQWDMFSKDDYFKFNQKWIKEALRVLKHG